MHAYFRPTISHKRAATARTASILAVEDEPAGAPPIFIKTCEGVLMKYRRDNSLKSWLTVYYQNSCISAGSQYKMGMFGPYYQVFAMDCTRRGGIQRKTSNVVCNKCFALRAKSGFKITQTIKNRAEKFLIVEEALSRKNLTPRDHCVR